MMEGKTETEKRENTAHLQHIKRINQPSTENERRSSVLRDNEKMMVARVFLREKKALSLETFNFNQQEVQSSVYSSK